MFDFSSRGDDDDAGSQWISVSDLMAGLMMVFLCVAIFMMSAANKEREKVRKIARSYMENQLALYESLDNEFQKDFKRWGAHLDKETLEITFQGADAMFATGDSQISEQYRIIFNTFFPRYMRVLSPFHASISGIHIEGHTSSSWSQYDDSGSYFKNLSLSQRRAGSVLEYLYFLDDVEIYRNWIIKNVAAVGYSSSRFVPDAAGNEDVERSKRVVFRVVTNSDSRIRSLLEE